MQNCIIYNDKTHALFTAKETREEYQLRLRNGEPMIFGPKKNKGIVLREKLEVVTIGEDGVTESDILVHDQYQQDPGVHLMLAKMAPPKFPLALGVIRSANYPTYDDMVEMQIAHAKANSKILKMDDLLNSGEMFEI